MYRKIICILILFISTSSLAVDKIPGLKGFGTDTRGEYGDSTNPTICIVNTLNPSTALSDSTRNGVSVKVGGFDSCLRRGNNTVILFEVSGYIDAGTPTYYASRYKNIGVYGQTAPSPGITFKNVYLTIRNSDNVFQHIRVRTGDTGTCAYPCDRDAIQIGCKITGGSVENILLDHVSASWGVDEMLSIYGDSTGVLSNITVANSIISEGLWYSIHTSGATEHSKGGFVSGLNSASPATNIALIKNLYAHVQDRAPLIQDASNVMIANNVTFNTGWFNTMIESYQDPVTAALINNVGIGGQNSSTAQKQYILTLWTSLYADGVGSSIYLSGNWVGQNTTTPGEITWNKQQSSSSDWTVVEDRFSKFDEGLFKVTDLNVTITGITHWDTTDVLDNIVDTAGARPADRDAVDTRIIGDLTDAYSDSGTLIDSIIRTVDDCTADNTPMAGCTAADTWQSWPTFHRNAEAGWPALAENTRSIEDISFPADPHADDDSDGYTNMEEWLQLLADGVEGVVSSSGTVQTGWGGGNITETQIVAGGNTIVYTLAGASWTTPLTDELKGTLIAGIDAQADQGATDWNTLVRDDAGTWWTGAGAVVLAGDTITVTLPAFATYDITANEHLITTIDKSLIQGATVDVTASPNITISMVADAGITVTRALQFRRIW